MVEGNGARFSGAVVVVTGGAHGIGLACAERLAQEGARVVVLDLDRAAAERATESLPGGQRGGHLGLHVDVTSSGSVDQAMARTADACGQIDALVNVAGGDTSHGGFEDTADDVWSTMFDLNLLGVVRCCRAAIPHLRRSGSRSAIVTVSSVNAVLALGSEPYSAAKAALGSLTVNLAASLAPDGIRVNAVLPGTISTRVWDDQEGGADRMAPLYPLGRVGTPADVAAAVAFLASSDAAWITGHLLPVDGGLLTARRILLD